MEIIRLDKHEKNLVEQCDNLFKKFLNSEGKYDNNYFERTEIKSFISDLENSNNILYCAIENKSVIAFLYAYISKSTGEKKFVSNLSFLYVDEIYRKTGVASTMLQNFIDEMKKQNIENIDVKAYNANEVAIK